MDKAIHIKCLANACTPQVAYQAIYYHNYYYWKIQRNVKALTVYSQINRMLNLQLVAWQLLNA